MSRKCEKHDMVLDLFCLGHNIAVCARCSQSDHFKCPQFVSVEDAAKYANPLSQRTARSHGSEEKRSPANILKTVNQEKNTFTNYVKAAIESGEQNTFTKFLQTNVTRSENDRIEESMKHSTPLATSRDFLVGENFGENNTFEDPSNPDNLESYRPLSEDFHHVSDIINVQAKEATTPKSHANSNKGKSEVGQLLENVKKFSKGLSSRDDVGITLDELILKIDRTLNEIAEKFENTRNQKKSIEYQIKEIRAKLNAHLDNIERKLLNSLESKFSHCEASVVNVVEKLQKGRIEITHMKSGNADNPNSPFQANTLLAIRESDKQMRRMKRSIHALTENVYAIDIDVRINQDLNIFINEVQAFGEVTVNSRLNQKISEPTVEHRRIEVIRTDSKRSQPSSSPSRTNSKAIQRTDSKKVKGVSKPKRSGSKREIIETTKRLETVQILPEIELGQHLAMMDEPLPEIITSSRSGISGIRIMQKKKVKIGHKWTSSVSNCKMLPNGRLIFIDTENKRLVIHNKDTYVYRNLRVNDSPRDFTILDNDRIAVTFGIYIEVLNILTSRIEKRIQLEFFECNGISFMDGKYYIYGIFDGYLLSRHGIQIMDMHGRIEDRLPITRVQTIHHSITTWRGRIYYTGYSSISCCMTSGEELWEFKHETMDRPKSVTIDNFGNVFASYENENKIVVISVDGLYSKEFELRKHDLYYGQEPRPISVYFDTVESALIVCNANKDHSVMYFVKYE
ncbi:unnamed protein product [Mytilus edulis]|uniref:B box-type domain-containing protein n=1 Tax=Mytilus edulis TaxID=6550 RepID=A0A8S3PZ68_MYTED|nr:unnamed protein product [Mytilus edulis]